jgi:anti-sigma regulatory factor (Ser/Thr protein kinase)
VRGITPVVPTILSHRWPATSRTLPEARHATIDALTEAGVADRQLLATIALAVSEAVGNAVRHAYPDAVGDISLTVENGHEEIRITVKDTGVGLDHHSNNPALGLGLQLIGTITSAWTIDSDISGTTLTMRFASNAEPQSPEHAIDVHGDPETPI